MRRRIWIHRAVAIACVLLAYPAIRWWSESILFVIVLSLATQAYAALSASEGADDRKVTDRLDRIEALLHRND
jgi:membrane protein implicated in regulation of membrane protease activity